MKTSCLFSLFASLIFCLLTLFISPLPAYASTGLNLITSGVPAQIPSYKGITFLTKDIDVNYTSGNMILSLNWDGTGSTYVDDAMEITVTKPDGSIVSAVYMGFVNPPINITNLFEAGKNHVNIRLYDIGGTAIKSSTMYLVNTNATDPIPSTPDSIFNKVSLAPIANWNYKDSSRNYLNPPLGDIVLGEIPFFIPEGNNSLNTSMVGVLTQRISTNIANPLKIHVLLNSGNAWLPTSGKEAGIIKLDFSDGTFYETRLKIGQNIREWIQYSETINTVTDPASQEVFSEPATYRHIVDMLTLDIPSDYQHKALTGVRLTDTYNTDYNVALLWSGLTIESSPQQACSVTTSPSTQTLSAGGTATISASVTSGLGNATVTRMRFGSYDPTLATVSPSDEGDNTSPYETTVTGVAPGGTAVWASADLSDGRTCQSTADTDTDITVTPAPTTFTSTFDILKNGYNFINSANTPTWDLFEQTFGKDQVDYNSDSSTHKPLAQAFYDDKYSPLLKAGNCFGVAATSLLFYTHNDDHNLIAENSTITAHDLPDPGLITNTHVWNATPVSEYIARYHGAQLGLENLLYRSSQSHNIIDVYNTVKHDLQQGFSDPSLIGIVDINSQGGHALVPYKLEDDPGGISKIFVYDPNDPCKPGSTCQPINLLQTDPNNRYISINFNATPVSWKYIFDPDEIKFLYGFIPYYQNAEVWENPLITTIPISLIKNKPTLQPLQDNLDVVLTGFADLLISNSQGHKIGYQSGSFVNDITGANINIPLLDGITRASPSYTLPSAAYTFLVQGKQTRNENIDIFGSSTLLQIENLPTATGSADIITTDQDNRSMTITTQDSKKTYNANLFIEPTLDYTKEFNVSGLTIASGETDTLTLTDDNQSIKYVNGGTNEDIHLTIKQTGQNGGTMQFDQPISVENGETLIIKPTDWDHLDTSASLIQVNPGDNGAKSYYLSVTSATLSLNPDADGKYNAPVTVTLSTTQPSGFNTYYKIDNGSQQSYSAALSVSGPGEHTLEYWSVDDNGIEETHNIKKFTIINHPPVANAHGQYSVEEGKNIILNGSGTDPDNNPLTYMWEMDSDGSFENSGQNPVFSAVDGAHSQTVSLKVCDNHNACATDQAEITITNVAPIVGTITAPSAPVAVNSPVSLSAAFTDPGSKDTHTAAWDFGDGTISDGEVSEASGSGKVTATHNYTKSGVYTIKLTVTDKDHGIGTSTYQYLVIYDPSGGFISAAGHFASPATAYLSDPQKTGDIKFGIDAKYKNNAPVGKTKLNFKEANLDFESTSYEWYVITDTKAQLKGKGTINDTGTYTFVITMNDSGLPEGQRQDKIRIKISYSNNQVVYDNQPGASDTADPTMTITNGAIKLHQ